MNELYFRIENSNWHTTTPSAFHFDSLIEYLEENIIEDLRVAFINNVIFPFYQLCRMRYLQVAQPYLQITEPEFKFYIPIKILEAALPAVYWYLANEPDRGKYRETAEDAIECFKKAKEMGRKVFIWGE